MDKAQGIFYEPVDNSPHMRAVASGDPPYEIRVFPWSSTRVFVLDQRVHYWPVSGIGTVQNFANLTVKIVGARWVLDEMDDLLLLPEAFYVEVVQDNWPY
jgi:hypothetical protein